MSRSEIRQARIAIIGIPSDENSSFMRGAAEAPQLIRQALASDAGSLWTESGIDLGTAGLLFDAGDIVPKAGADYFGVIGQSIAALTGSALGEASRCR